MSPEQALLAAFRKLGFEPHGCAWDVLELAIDLQEPNLDAKFTAWLERAAEARA